MFFLLQVEDTYQKAIANNYPSLVNATPFKLLKFVALKAYNLIYMGWCLTPFIFLSFDRWIEVFKAVNYFGFIYVAVWFIIYKIYKSRKPSQRKPSERVDLSPTINETLNNDRDSKATHLSPNLQDNKKEN